jgi:hypothetical protein
MEPLVHAQRDGRLGKRDGAALERHLETCTECQALARDLERVAALADRVGDGLPDRTELEQRRARLRLLREAATPARPEQARRPQRRWAVAALATAGAVAVLALGAPLASRSPAEPDELARWTVPSVPSAAPAPAGEQATVRPAPTAQFTRERTAGLEQVRLRAGRIDVYVPRLADGERFVVITADAEVEVRGTDFQVAAAGDLLRAVLVREGVVEVRRKGDSIQLRAGQQWRAPDEVAALPADGRTPGAEQLDEAAADPGQRSGSSGASRSEARGQERASSGRDHEATADEARERLRDPASIAFAQAVRLLEQGHYERAAARLSAFALEHPDDPRAEDARFLVIVAQQRAGRRTAAELAARDYLKRHPDGDRRAEAQSIAAGRD